MYDDSKDLPTECELVVDDPKCELIVDDPKKTLADFPKIEFRPGKYSYMNNSTINYVFKHLKMQYGEKPTAVYINSIEEA